MDAPKNEKLSITIENIDKYEKAAIMYFLWSMEILGNIGASGIILFSCGIFYIFHYHYLEIQQY